MQLAVGVSILHVPKKSNRVTSSRPRAFQLPVCLALKFSLFCPSVHKSVTAAFLDFEVQGTPGQTIPTGTTKHVNLGSACGVITHQLIARCKRRGSSYMPFQEFLHTLKFQTERKIRCRMTGLLLTSNGGPGTSRPKRVRTGRWSIRRADLNSKGDSAEHKGKLQDY